MSTRIDAVVIGGGYAGVMAANRLTRREDVAVTLINPRATFVDRIRLHQLIAGTGTATAELAPMLAGRVRLVVGTASRIDAAGRTVVLDDGRTIGYDHLVYAVGSGSAPSPVPGAAEHALPLSVLDDAERVRAALDAAPAGAAVVVVGAGPTGIEVAAELAESGRSVVLACGPVLGPYLHPRTRRSVTARLERLGVRVLRGPGSTVVEVLPDAVRTSGGETVPGAVTIWTAGFGVPDLAARSGLSVDRDGRLLIDETLTGVDDDRIVAAGDAAAPSGLPYRMSCQAALQLGPAAAETVLRRIAGGAPAPVATAFAGQCISLGRRAGVFQFARPDDVAVPARIGGRGGAAVKETICRSILWQLGFEARHPGVLRLALRDPSRGRRVRAARKTAPVPEPVP